jgi:hypothetical protein
MTCRVRRLCKAAAVAGLLVLAAVLPSAGLAQEAGDPETAVDALSAENAAVPSVGPSLTCTGRGLPIMAPVVQVHGMALTCTVASAAPGDTSFTLRAVLGGPGGAGRTIDPLCTGSLAKGTGGVDPLRRTPEDGGYLPRWSPPEWTSARGAGSPKSSKPRQWR